MRPPLPPVPLRRRPPAWWETVGLHAGITGAAAVPQLVLGAAAGFAGWGAGLLVGAACLALALRPGRRATGLLVFVLVSLGVGIVVPRPSLPFALPVFAGAGVVLGARAHRRERVDHAVKAAQRTFD